MKKMRDVMAGRALAAAWLTLALLVEHPAGTGDADR